MATIDAALIVNQKLTFARIALKAAQESEPEADPDRESRQVAQARLAQHAHLDSALLQLHQALGFFLVEVAEQYRLDLPFPQSSLQVLAQALLERQPHSPQARAVLDLLNNPDSWLSQLDTLPGSPRRLAEQFKAHRPREASSALIAAVDVTNNTDNTQPPLVWVQGFYQQTQAFIDQHRAALVEE